MNDEFWDTIWSGKLVTSSYSQKYIDFMAEIGDAMPEGSSILEAGCGTAQALKYLSERHYTVGLDRSLVALEHAKSNCECQAHGDILNIPFCRNRFDLVFNSGVIEHFSNRDACRAVREMARVTKRGGIVVVIVPNTYCLWYRILKKWNGFEFCTEGDFTMTRLKEMVKHTGLNVERMFGFQVFPPLASHEWELLPENLRLKLGRVEKVFPFREYYAYVVGIVARKE